MLFFVYAEKANSYQSYTTRERVIDIGSLQVTVDKTRTLPLLLIVDCIAREGDIVLLVMGNK